MKRIAIFASGNGSNFMKIYENTINGKIPAKISLFISDNSQSRAAEFALSKNMPMYVFTASHYNSKSDYEYEILTLLKIYEIDLIVLAGYMRIIGPTILDVYEHRIINIHPSLLPDFKGKNAILKAWNAKVNYTGVTVHYVDEKIDHGKVILQEKLPLNFETIEELTIAIHEIEHRIYTDAIIKVLEEIS